MGPSDVFRLMNWYNNIGGFLDLKKAIAHLKKTNKHSKGIHRHGFAELLRWGKVFTASADARNHGCSLSSLYAN